MTNRQEATCARAHKRQRTVQRRPVRKFKTNKRKHKTRAKGELFLCLHYLCKSPLVEFQLFGQSQLSKQPNMQERVNRQCDKQVACWKRRTQQRRPAKWFSIRSDVFFFFFLFLLMKCICGYHRVQLVEKYPALWFNCRNCFLFHGFLW